MTNTKKPQIEGVKGTDNDPHARLHRLEREYRRALRYANHCSPLFQKEANRVLAEVRNSLRAARAIVRGNL